MNISEGKDMNEKETLLEGGNINEVLRVGNTVRRPLKSWSYTIHRLLNHLEKNTFAEAPRFYGIDENNREILSFIPGETAVEFPRVKAYMLSNEVLADIASILKKLHDITSLFKRYVNDEWMLTYPGDLPEEVICHNDCAPYNVVFSQEKVRGIIDFDTACPGPRMWDIAYTLYTFVPLGRFQYHPSTDNMFNYEYSKHGINRKERIRIFLEAYGITKPADLMDQIVFRLEALCNTLTTKADNGDKAFKRMIDEGHLIHYKNEIEFIKLYGHQWI